MENYKHIYHKNYFERVKKLKSMKYEVNAGF